MKVYLESTTLTAYCTQYATSKSFYDVFGDNPISNAFLAAF